MKMKNICAAVISLIFVSVLLTGCQSQSGNSYSSPTATPTVTPSATPTPTATGSTAAVSIQNFSFVPQNLAISAGTTVTWTNNDSTTHTVTENSSAFDSGNLAPGATFSFKFTVAGTFEYHCGIHTSMTGSVTVQ